MNDIRHLVNWHLAGQDDSPEESPDHGFSASEVSITDTSLTSLITRHRIKKAGIISFPQVMPHLEKLVVFYRIPHGLENCPNLRELELTSIFFTDLTVLNNLTELRKLRFCGIVEKPCDFSQLKKLKLVELRLLTNVVPPFVHALTALPIGRIYIELSSTIKLTESLPVRSNVIVKTILLPKARAFSARSHCVSM